MFSKTSLVVLTCLLPVVLGDTKPPDFDVDRALVGQLKLAPSHDDRIALLEDGQFVFNFLAGLGVTAGSGGDVVTANSGTFPAVIGNGMAMSIGMMEPCGLNTPHVHPRATEFNLAVNGTLRTGFLAENGARFVFNDVPAGSATVFPKGAIHFEMNTECTPTLFVAAFNDEDPGASAVAQRFFGLPPDIVLATLDSLGIQEIAGLESKIPNNMAQGTADCLKKCGITKATQPTTQRQPRIASNALPSGYSGPAPPPPASPPPPLPSSNGTKGSLSGGGSHVGLVATGSSSEPSDDSHIKSILIALLVINGVFVVGILAAVFMYVARKRGGRPERVDPMAPQFAPLREEKDTEYYDPYHRPTSPMSGDRS